MYASKDLMWRKIWKILQNILTTKQGQRRRAVRERCREYARLGLSRLGLGLGLGCVPWSVSGSRDGSDAPVGCPSAWLRRIYPSTAGASAWWVPVPVPVCHAYRRFVGHARCNAVMQPWRRQMGACGFIYIHIDLLYWHFCPQRVVLDGPPQCGDLIVSTSCGGGRCLPFHRHPELAGISAGGGFGLLQCVQPRREGVCAWLLGDDSLDSRLVGTITSCQRSLASWHLTATPLRTPAAAGSSSWFAIVKRFPCNGSLRPCLVRKNF